MKVPYLDLKAQYEPIRVKDRDALIAALDAKDIHCGIHYPIPLQPQETYKSLGDQKGSFPGAEKAASEFVSRRCFRSLPAQIAKVAAELKAIVASPMS